MDSIERMLKAVAPLVAKVHEDGVDAPYPQWFWAPVLVEIRDAAKELETARVQESATRMAAKHGPSLRKLA